MADAARPDPQPPILPEPMPGRPPAPVEPIREPLAVPQQPAGRRPWLSPLNQRRWRSFRRNGRAFWWASSRT